MKRSFFFLLCIIGCIHYCDAQRLTPQEYVAQYKDMAIREMKRMGVPAAITLAQGILESESGNSELVKKSNNHFGIKCKSSWTAATVTHDDDERGECFRAYNDAEESYRDHSNFLRGSARYGFLFDLDPTDYKAWAYGLSKAGYATNPRYPQILITQIETYNLQQYTLQADDQVPPHHPDAFIAQTEPSPLPEVRKQEPITSAGPATGQRLTINGKRAVMAAKGTSLLAIATANHIALKRLMEYNDLEEDGLLSKDQLIFLERKQKQGNTDYYKVLPGESLHDVAQKNGVTLESLIYMNNLGSTQVAAGTMLYLRAQDIGLAIKNAPARTTDELTNAPTMHEVKPREGLYSISKKYGVSVDQLKAWNNLPDDQLKIGQRLIISK